MVLAGESILSQNSRRSVRALLKRMGYTCAILTAVGLTALMLFPKRQIETPVKTPFFNKSVALLRLETASSLNLVLEHDALQRNSRIAHDKKDVYFFDYAKQDLLKAQLPAFSQSAIPAHSLPQEAEFIGILDPYIAVFLAPSPVLQDSLQETSQSHMTLHLLDLAAGTVHPLSPPQEAAVKNIFEPYRNSMYRLNRETGEMYKLGVAIEAPEKIQEAKWISPASLKRPIGAADIAIDGSVYVLFNDGTVELYQKGNYLTSFHPAIEPKLENPDVIFTASEQAYLWILERAHSRVIALTKEGEFVKQFHFPTLANIKDIYAAPDNTLYLLDSGKLYSYKANLE